MDFELRRGTTAAALASGSRACRHWDALKALAAGPPDVDDLRLLTGIIGVAPSGQARQIPRRLLPRRTGIAQIRHSPPRILRLYTHHPKAGFPQLTPGCSVGHWATLLQL